jgi:hypothetical protein
MEVVELMSRLKLLALAALAVVSLNAVASSAASGASCVKEASKKFVLCIGEPLVLTELNKVDVDIRSAGPYTLVAAGITIKCEKIFETLTLMDALGGAVTFLPFQLHFVECKVVAEHCVLESELILTEKLEGKVNGKEEQEFFPEKGTAFATVKINSSGGTCLVAGSDKVTTKEGLEKEGPLCGDNDAEKTQKLHLVECGSKSSMLKFAGKEATFRGNFDTVLLLEKVEDLWAIIEGK